MRTLTFIIILSISSSFVNAQSFDKVWETEKVLKIPESVLYDEIKDQIYVSNINGKPTVKDGNGFISLLDREGNIKNLKWVTGMHAPKGMAVLNDSLFVTDIDRIHIISINQVKIIQTIEVKGANFLNDIIVMNNGVAYITDTQEEKILILNNGNVEFWLADTMLVKPNGLAIFKDDIAVGVKNSILKVNIISKNISLYIDETGPVDGLIYLGRNKFVVSDWAGRILLVNPSEKIVLSNSTEKNIQAADLGYIPDSKIVLVPTFSDNRVIAAQLP